MKAQAQTRNEVQPALVQFTFYVMWLCLMAGLFILPNHWQPIDPFLTCACAFMAGRKFQRMLEEL